MNFRRLLLDASKESESFLEFARTEFALDLVHFWLAVEECKQVRPRVHYSKRQVFARPESSPCLELESRRTYPTAKLSVRVQSKSTLRTSNPGESRSSLPCRRRGSRRPSRRRARKCPPPSLTTSKKSCLALFSTASTRGFSNRQVLKDEQPSSRGAMVELATWTSKRRHCWKGEADIFPVSLGMTAASAGRRRQRSEHW